MTTDPDASFTAADLSGTTGPFDLGAVGGSWDTWDAGTSWAGSGFSDVSWSAWESQLDWSSAANDYWVAGDTASYWTADALADDMGWYSSSMEYLADDPTDWAAWSDAWESAESASWDAWDQSLDAWAAGDYETAAYWESVSDDYGSLADSTWSSWDDSWSAAGSTYDTSSSTSLISDNSYDF